MEGIVRGRGAVWRRIGIVRMMLVVLEEVSEDVISPVGETVMDFGGEGFMKGSVVDVSSFGALSPRTMRVKTERRMRDLVKRSIRQNMVTFVKKSMCCGDILKGVVCVGSSRTSIHFHYQHYLFGNEIFVCLPSIWVTNILLL